MERTNPTTSKIHYDTDLEPIILSKPLLDQLLQQEYGSPADLIALYAFYYYTAKWQRTNQPKATTGYAAKGLQWGEDRVRRTKKILKHLGLITDITTKRKSDGQVTGHYIKINFIWTREKSNQVMQSHPIEIKEGGHPPGSPHCGESHPVATKEGNALSYNSKNALSYNSKNALSVSTSIGGGDGKITPSQFTQFWELYPKKAGSKGNAKKIWERLCSSKNGKRPEWRTIRKAIHEQKKTEQWQDKKYIPHPTTWLNQERWIDDPESMNQIPRNTSSRQRPQASNDYQDTRKHSYVKEV